MLLTGGTTNATLPKEVLTFMDLKSVPRICLGEDDSPMLDIEGTFLKLPALEEAETGSGVGIGTGEDSHGHGHGHSHGHGHGIGQGQDLGATDSDKTEASLTDDQKKQQTANS